MPLRKEGLGSNPELWDAGNVKLSSVTYGVDYGISNLAGPRWWEAVACSRLSDGRDDV